jgi:hypothetical protein
LHQLSADFANGGRSQLQFRELGRSLRTLWRPR